MSWETIINLEPYFFHEVEKKLAGYGGLSAYTFLYPGGVAGLRLANQAGQVVLLPFQGQQVWDVQFQGRSLTMKSMFEQPRPTQIYLQTYGGFLLHCGATAMGVPTERDNHPLHGELPNAPYQTAQLLVGQDERGSYMAVTGSYQYTVAFNHNYLARPVAKLYAGEASLVVSMTIQNLKHTTMELMYMAHANFRPVDNGELIYSAPCTPDTVRVRSSVPSHLQPPPGYREFLQELEQRPEQHNVLKPGLTFDPEVVLYIDYRTDAEGWAYTMQRHPDGSADYIKHRPAELDHGVRWISRTPDQQALGMVLPATAEPEGYAAEKAKGNIKTIPAEGTWSCQFEVGALAPAEVGQMRDKIQQILAG